MNYKDFNPDELFDEVTEDLVAYVFERDSGLCQISGCRGEVIHHIKYRSLGGKHCANNLILLSDKVHKYEHDVRATSTKVFLYKVKRNEERFRMRLV